MTKFALGERYSASILLLAAQDDFVQNVRKLQFTGLILAIVVGAAFLPLVWMFGSRMARSLNAITAQARKLQTLAEPDPVPVTSHIAEIHELGNTVNLAQRAIWSFAHFVPKEIVRRVLDNSISTRLGGANRRSRWSSRTSRALPRSRICRSRRADAADVALLLRADASLPRRRWHDRQVYRRRGHGVLERPQPAARPCSACLPGGTCSPSRRRAAQRRV